MPSFVQKYNVPGPRYTSYPTVPYWDTEKFNRKAWENRLTQMLATHNSKEGVSLYIHLPFCESLCTFCGCNKRITKRHEVEAPYIKAVLKEWKLYRQYFKEQPLIKEIHLGGGTPTFFSVEHLERLIQGILKDSHIADNYSFSFEGHPNNTTKEHLQALYDLGFRRVSYGVQDYNMAVQIAIHRIQPFENVKKVTEWAREIGYTSVGHDIIFGLPYQTLEHVKYTIQKTKELLPDRIAFYSYAHVPWIKGNGQRGFSEEHLPTPQLKRTQYETGKQWLEEMGYIEIGMDHFALPDDALTKAMNSNTLHRNFMGYTTTTGKVMIGLGVSAISDSWTAFAQNEKKIEDYYAELEQDRVPVYRGHILSNQDRCIRTHILNLMCHFETAWTPEDETLIDFDNVKHRLREMERDGLVILSPNTIKIPERGRPFVRNVCMAFDVLLQQKQPQTQLFSMTV